MTEWRKTTSAQFRNLEREQRALAQGASSTATRDIHLEFAERYRLKAEELDAAERQRRRSERHE